MGMKQDKPLVLVVDDEPEILDAVASALTGGGFLCRCCTSPETAMAAAKQNPPDLIISDINLGGESGLALCESFKTVEELAEIPVLFLSGAQIPDIIRRSHEAGGTYYIRKPFDPEVLLELVDKALWMPHLVSAHTTPKAPISTPTTPRVASM